MRKIYIVYEDNHGEVSYWTSKRKAYKEARIILLSCSENVRFSNSKRKRINEMIEEGYFCVEVYEKRLNKSWG